jgi:hypothetical protein
MADMTTHVTQVRMKKMQNIGMTTSSMDLFSVKHTSGVSSASRSCRFSRGGTSPDGPGSLGLK